MDPDVKLAYLVWFDCRPDYGSSEFVGLSHLKAKHFWLANHESFVHFALRLLIGRLR